LSPPLPSSLAPIKPANPGSPAEMSVKMDSEICVRRYLIDESETWLLKMEHEVNFVRNETSSLRWRRSFAVKQRERSIEIRQLFR